jgi:hypothetical protein
MFPSIPRPRSRALVATILVTLLGGPVAVHAAGIPTLPHDQPLSDWKRTLSSSGASGKSALSAGNLSVEENKRLGAGIDNLGSGVSDITGDALNDCVDGTVDGANGTFVTTTSVTVIDQSSDISETLKAEASASVSIGVWSARAQSTFERNTNVSRSRTFLLVRSFVAASQDNPTLVLRHAKLRQPAPATDADLADFHQQCGDSFVSGIQYGGEFLAMLSVETSTLKSSQAVGAKVEVESPSGSGSGSINVSREELVKNSHTEMDALRVGTPNEAMPKATPQDILDYAENFSKKVTTETATIIGVRTTSYRRLGVRERAGVAVAGAVARQMNDAIALRRDSADTARRSLRLLPALGSAVTDRVVEARAFIGRMDTEVARLQDQRRACDEQPMQCTFPRDLAQFRAYGGQVPVSLPLEGTSDRVITLTVTEPGRKLLLTGSVCFRNQELCFANGAGVVQVVIDNRRQTYQGKPLDILVHDGLPTVVTIQIKDTDYQDNTGSYTAVIY